MVIVGGGAAGAAVFCAVLARQPAGCVHWVTGEGEPGRGIAYATPDPLHLLNVPAGGMGLVPGEDGAFADFAADRCPGTTALDFLPRSLFGDFVRARLDACTAAAGTAGAVFAVHPHRAVRVVPDAQGYRVRLDTGHTLAAAQVVLAPGALAPRPLPGVSAEAVAGGRYVVDPWQPIDPPAPPRRVVVVGTGLTAVDLLLSAAARWPDAALVAVSRHGRLPFPHPVRPAGPWPGQQALNDRLAACGSLRGMLGAVREAVRHGGSWQAVVDGLRPATPALWRRLPPAEQRRFLRHLRWLWEAARHRMAPANAGAIATLQAQGRLQVVAGRVQSVVGTAPVRVSVSERGTGRPLVLRADLVLQATGLDLAVGMAGDPMLAALLEDGLAQPDPLRLGLRADPDGRLLDAAGRPQPALHAIGSLLRGVSWECTAMPEIRNAAARLAQRLCPDPPREAAAGVRVGGMPSVG